MRVRNDLKSEPFGNGNQYLRVSAKFAELIPDSEVDGLQSDGTFNRNYRTTLRDAVRRLNSGATEVCQKSKA